MYCLLITLRTTLWCWWISVDFRFLFSYDVFAKQFSGKCFGFLQSHKMYQLLTSILGKSIKYTKERQASKQRPYFINLCASLNPHRFGPFAVWDHLLCLKYFDIIYSKTKNSQLKSLTISSLASVLSLFYHFQNAFAFELTFYEQQQKNRQRHVFKSLSKRDRTCNFYCFCFAFLSG